MADYVPASTAKVDWTPNVNSGVGVPGGIPARATIYTTLTSTGDNTDRTDAIQAALLACPTGQTVLLGAGVFYIRYTEWGAGYCSNKTLRGSGTSAITGTTIVSLAGGNGFHVRGSENYNTSNTGVITGTPVKGDTTISITNSSGIAVGGIMHLSTQNDDSLPVRGLGGLDFHRVQTVRVTAVNTGAGTVTFQPPLYQSPVKRTTGALAMRWSQHSNPNAQVNSFGLENLRIDTTAIAINNTLYITGTYGSWFTNLQIVGVDRYGIYPAECCQCEFRTITIDPNGRSNWYTSSHAGITLSTVSALLFEDITVSKNFPLIEPQGGSMSGCVFGYNFGLQVADARIPFSYHSVGNHCNLWEGNSGTGWFVDGYFGSNADDVIYRNDWHGVIDGSAQPGYPIFLGRMSRRYEIVGNQLGRSGTTLNVRAGPKTPFNEGSVGVANNYAGDPHVDTLMSGILTTRTSDTVGIITMNTTLGSLALGSPYLDDIGSVGVQWGPAATFSWAGCARGAVNTGALTLAISNASSPLPAQGTAVQVFTGPNGSLEFDDGVLASTILLGNYYYSQPGIPAAQALGTTTLPASLYRSAAPSFMSGYTWPPFSPITPDPRYAAIPAGFRYEGGVATVAQPTISPIAGTYGEAQSVSLLSATAGATIYYTLDGTTPTVASLVYSTPISIIATTTVKAFATKTAMTNSGVTTAVFTILTVPAAPTGFTATAVSSSQINLTWTDTSSNETGFRVESSLDPGTYSTVATTAANVQSYSVTGLSPNTYYLFRLAAVNGGGVSAYLTSNATTLPVPSRFVASNLVIGTLTL